MIFNTKGFRKFQEIIVITVYHYFEIKLKPGFAWWHREGSVKPSPNSGATYKVNFSFYSSVCAFLVHLGMKSPFCFASAMALCKSYCKISNDSLRSTPFAPDRVKLFPLLKLKQWNEDRNVNSSYLEQVINTQLQKKSERKVSFFIVFLNFH